MTATSSYGIIIIVGRSQTAIFLFVLLFDNYTIKSDEIVKVKNTDGGLDICVESDLTSEYHHIIIYHSKTSIETDF